MCNSNRRISVREWLPVVALTFSGFIFNTSEFIPIGLLTDIAEDFHITEAHAGMLISVYAWVVALTSLPLMLLVSKMEYRRLLLCIVGLFIVSHALSAFSSGYATLMMSRVGVACSHAVFWSIASPLAVRIAPQGKGSVALGMIVTGTSIAMIVGFPLGRIIGLSVGWRMTFLCVGVIALLIFLMLAVVFPKVPNTNTLSLHKLPSLFENKALTGIYLLTLVVVTAHYTGYSYIEPFLGQVAGLKDEWITLVLTVFGISGIVGSVLFSRYFDRSPRPFICFSVIGITLFLLLLRLATIHPVTIILLCACWGVAITAFNLVFQSEIIRFAPQSTTIAMSVYSGTFNVGIGGGALVGGTVCAYSSISYIGYVGGIIAAGASVYCVVYLLQLLQPKN